MKVRQILYSFLAASLLGACSDTDPSGNFSLNDCPQVAIRQLVGNDSVVVCNLDLIKDTLNIPLSQLIDDFKIIKLDSKDEALVKSYFTHITDNYIGVYSGRMIPYKLFDKEGNFLRTIGSIGQGPNEYTLVYDSQIDEKNKRVYLLPWNTKQLLVYDFDGNNLPPVPLPTRIPKGIFQVDTDKGIVTIGILPFRYMENKSIIWQQDMKGNIIQETDATPFFAYDDFSNEVSNNQNTGQFDFYIFHWGAQEDSLYHYDKAANRLVPIFTIPFETEEIPKHDYIELPGHYIAEITTKVVGGTSMGGMNILVDKQTLKGCYFNLVNDFLGNMLITRPIFYFQDGKFTLNMDPGNLLDALETVLAKSAKLPDAEIQKLTEFKNSISIDDNNYLLTGKLKQEAKKLTASTGTEAIPIQIKSTKETGTIDSTEQENPDLIYYTATLETWKSYFPAHNKYKDWDSKNAKQVLIGANIDKYGKPHDVKIIKSSGIKELDEEAIRLIQEAPIVPAKNKDGKNVEQTNWGIPVYFPPR